MKEAVLQFLKKIIITSLLMCAAVFLTIMFIPQLTVSYKHLYIVLFFFLTSLLFHYLIIKLSIKKMKFFTNYFMGSVLIKLFLYSGVIIWYIFNYKEDAKVFVAVFFANYIVFTVLEVIALQKFVKHVK